MGQRTVGMKPTRMIGAPIAVALAVAFAALQGVAKAEPADEALAAYQRKDYATALRIWKPLAEQGNARAQSSLAAMFENGQGLPQDLAAALEWNRKAAEQGDALGEASLGEMYSNGRGVPRDYSVALGWYQRAADQGYVQSEFDVGLMHEMGQGIGRDVPGAIRWYRKAAAQGNADALVRLNHWVDQGALKRGIAAAAKGDRGAAYQVAMLYGQEFDDENERLWFRKAAELGDAESQRRLGVLLSAGQGGPPDAVEGNAWSLKAAEGGNRPALGDLSRNYERGFGVKQDFVEAYKWDILWRRFTFPDGKPNPREQQRVDQLKSHMTADQAAEAERWASEWAASPARK
jgi:hypothetical protein